MYCRYFSSQTKPRPNLGQQVNQSANLLASVNPSTSKLFIPRQTQPCEVDRNGWFKDVLVGRPSKRNIAAVRIIFLRQKRPSTTKLHFLESINKQSPASQFNVVLFGLDQERLIKESSRTELAARLDELRYKH